MCYLARGMSEIGVNRRAIWTWRVSVALRHLTCVSTLAAAVCLLVSGCSPGAEYPTIFPAVHDMPPPRADAPMNPDQVQQATEDLITQRNQLEGQGSGQSKTGAPVSATGQTKKPAGAASSAKGAPAAKTQAANAGVTQSAGAETK
jgi:hypothetical protein